jgi:hypothetical protein
MRRYINPLFLLALCFMFISGYSGSVQNPAPEEISKRRIIVSTDIGGTDPDDFQSMVHLLLYTDVIELEGLISSPFGPGSKDDILTVIDKYSIDYASLSSHSDAYPSPDYLRSITKQGEKRRAPFQGYRTATEGSNWIIERARVDDPRPIYLLVWGGIEDLAQALNDAPEILPKLRVYWIGGPNKKWSADAYQYIADNHPELWMIESNATYRGWFVGGDQGEDYGNASFVKKHISGRGAMGEFFDTQLEGVIKMGDTPSLIWALHENPDDPSVGGWGGQYTRAWTRPHKVYERVTNEQDEIEEFGVFELALPVKNASAALSAKLLVRNQELDGTLIGDKMWFRICPKGIGKFEYTIVSNSEELNNLKGSFTALATALDQPVDARWPNWWVDDPNPKFKEGLHIGAKTINRWRKHYLDDFARLMQRVEGK